MTAAGKKVARLDPWLELQFAASFALRQPKASRAAVGESAMRCAWPHVDGIARPHAQTLAALRTLALVWRDVPAEARDGFDMAMRGVVRALETWPPHLQATRDELAAERQARAARRSRPAAPTTPPYWIKD